MKGSEPAFLTKGTPYSLNYAIQWPDCNFPKIHQSGAKSKWTPMGINTLLCFCYQKTSQYCTNEVSSLWHSNTEKWTCVCLSALNEKLKIILWLFYKHNATLALGRTIKPNDCWGIVKCSVTISGLSIEGNVRSGFNSNSFPFKAIVLKQITKLLNIHIVY